jgi:hypothetical protein
MRAAAAGGGEGGVRQDKKVDGRDAYAYGVYVCMGGQCMWYAWVGVRAGEGEEDTSRREWRLLASCCSVVVVRWPNADMTWGVTLAQAAALLILQRI